MSLQDAIMQKVKEARTLEFLCSNQLSLGKLIKKIRSIAKEQEERLKEGLSEAVVIHSFCGLFPTEIDSWRGSYDELALNFTSFKNDKEPMTVSVFLKMLEETVGKTFIGYKGGEFKMDEGTPVWIDNYGESSHTQVVGVLDDGYWIVLIAGYGEY